MRLKIYRAAGMADAIAQVRADLGADALILNARNVAGGIEVTAALEVDAPPVQADSDRLGALMWHGVPGDLQPALAHGDLGTAIARALAFGLLPLGARDPPLMLIGPPGAGKTLTTVRLATRLIIGGVSPVIVTTDGKRAGATEQLAAFTRLLGVPLLVASHPAGLERALTQRPQGAPVLIDTAGADPRDRDQAEELREFAHISGAGVALVLPAGLDPAEAADLAIANADCGASHMIVTRLDLSRRLGGVIAAAAASRLPLTEAGIGSGAADGLVPCTAAFLAARLSHSVGRSHVP